MLEGGRDLDLVRKPQEKRPRIRGQAALQIGPNPLDIEGFIGDENRHACPSLGTRDRDAVNGHVENAPQARQAIAHFGRGHVLALPAKSIANPIYEIIKALFVLQHEIAGSEPAIALLEYIAQDLFLGVGFSRVAFESCRCAFRNAADRFACLVRFARNAKAVPAAHNGAGLNIMFYELDLRVLREKRRHAADGAWDAIHIIKRECALCCSVELEDIGNIETLLELLPHRRAQSVSAAKP